MREPATGPTPSSLWDVRDVAGFLKVSRSWVYHRVEAGELPCLRIGGLLRFDPDAIRAFVVAQAKAAAAPFHAPRSALGPSDSE